MKHTKYTRLKLVFTLTALSVSVNPITSSAAPITFNSALPVSQNERILRGLVTIDERSSNQNDINIERKQLSLTSVLAYGISSRWSVFGVLPVHDIDLSIDDINESQSGVGDAEVFSRYEAFRVDKARSTLRVAPFLGVRLPTGENGVTSDGTTDVFGGVIVTSASTKQNLDFQLRYDINGSDNQFSAGDSLNLDFSWQRRVFPKNVSASTQGFFFAALETNLNYSSRNHFDDQVDSNSGGFTASIAPGIQYITRRWIAELAVRVPIIDDLNGSALEPKYTVFTGIRTNF